MIIKDEIKQLKKVCTKSYLGANHQVVVKSILDIIEALDNRDRFDTEALTLKITQLQKKYITLKHDLLNEIKDSSASPLIEPKPCAHCGNEDVIFNQHANGARIYCEKCGMSTGRKWLGIDAIETWNKRVNEDLTKGDILA